MTRAQQVNDAISKKWPENICDACVAKAMRLRYDASTPAINAIALATTSDFERDRGVCAVCQYTRIVTRRVTQPR